MRFGILELNSTDLNFGAGEDWSVLMDKNKTGIEFMKEGKWEEAAKSFMEAIEENPGMLYPISILAMFFPRSEKRKKLFLFSKKRSRLMKEHQRLITVPEMYILNKKILKKQRTCLNKRC